MKSKLSKIFLLRYVICSKGNSINIINIKNGAVVRQLLGHKDKVVFIMQDYFNGNLIISTSLDRNIKIWDLTLFQCIFTAKVDFFIQSIVTDWNNQNYFYIISKKKNEESEKINYQLFHYNISENTLSQPILEIDGKNPRLLMMQNQHLIVYFEKTIYVIDNDQKVKKIIDLVKE